MYKPGSKTKDGQLLRVVAKPSSSSTVVRVPLCRAHVRSCLQCSRPAGVNLNTSPAMQVVSKLLRAVVFNLFLIKFKKIKGNLFYQESELVSSILLRILLNLFQNCALHLPDMLRLNKRPRHDRTSR